MGRVSIEVATATTARPIAHSKAEARLLKLKTYHGPECDQHPGNFTRYTSNGSCVICMRYGEQTGRTGKIRGYVAKRSDKLAYRHPVSPWPITAENMHLCPDLSPGKGSPWT